MKFKEIIYKNKDHIKDFLSSFIIFLLPSFLLGKYYFEWLYILYPLGFVTYGLFKLRKIRSTWIYPWSCGILITFGIITGIILKVLYSLIKV